MYRPAEKAAVNVQEAGRAAASGSPNKAGCNTLSEEKKCVFGYTFDKKLGAVTGQPEEETGLLTVRHDLTGSCLNSRELNIALFSGLC